MSTRHEFHRIWYKLIEMKGRRRIFFEKSESSLMETTEIKWPNLLARQQD